MTEQYLNNPLHGLKLETLLTELVDHYGWEILAAALNFNCFKLNPTLKGSLKFLKKTEWARQKLESFYLYRYKNLPRPDDKQFALPPRDRIIPEDQKPRQPVELNLEELVKIQERKQKAAANKPKPSGRSSGQRKPSRDNPSKRSFSNQSNDRPSSSSSSDASFDPWGDARKKLAEKSKKDE